MTIALDEKQYLAYLQQAFTRGWNAAHTDDNFQHCITEFNTLINAPTPDTSMHEMD